MLVITIANWPTVWLATPQQQTSGAWSMPSPFHALSLGIDVKYIFIPCARSSARESIDDVITALNGPGMGPYDAGVQAGKQSSYQFIFKHPTTPTGYPTAAGSITPQSVNGRCIIWEASAAHWDAMVDAMFANADGRGDCEYPTHIDEVSHCAAYTCTAMGTAQERKVWLLNATTLNDVNLWNPQLP
eukprot:UN02296